MYHHVYKKKLFGRPKKYHNEKNAAHSELVGEEDTPPNRNNKYL